MSFTKASCLAVTSSARSRRSSWLEYLRARRDAAIYGDRLPMRSCGHCFGYGGVGCFGLRNG